MFDITLLHPKVVHFTIALFSVSVLFDILGLITKKRYFQSAAWLNLILAGAASVVTVISGLLAASNAAHDEAAHQVIEIHEKIGFIVLGIILVLLLWRILLRGRFPVRLSFLYVVLAVVGVGFMFTGAYFGGELVYTHGVAVKAVPVSKEEAEHKHKAEGNDHGAIRVEGLETTGAPASPSISDQDTTEAEHNR
jgi:uncharacterized membrane protein